MSLATPATAGTTSVHACRTLLAETRSWPGRVSSLHARTDAGGKPAPPTWNHQNPWVWAAYRSIVDGDLKGRNFVAVRRVFSRFVPFPIVGSCCRTAASDGCQGGIEGKSDAANRSQKQVRTLLGAKGRLKSPGLHKLVVHPFAYAFASPSVTMRPAVSPSDIMSGQNWDQGACQTLQERWWW